MMNKIKYSLCLLLVVGVLVSLCACGEPVNNPTEPTGSEAATEPTGTTGTEVSTEPTGTEVSTEPTQAPTDPVVNENSVGVYRCTYMRITGETEYQESPDGYGIDIYEDGTAMIYVADCLLDLSWKVEGDQFTATTVDGSDLSMEGTIKDDILEVTFDGMDLRFEKKSQQELADEAVEFLRFMMEDTPQQFAVAYLGWKESDEDLQKVMNERCPNLLGSNPFISMIPEERIFGNKGEIYCVVPNDPDINITIRRLQDAPNVEDMVKEVLYEGKLGEPFFLLANEGDFYQDTQVIFTDSEGNQTLWYPMTDQYYTAHIPDNEDGELLGYDFSYYNEIYPYGYNLWMRDGWDWVEEDYLTKTVWSRYFEMVHGDAYAGYTWTMDLSEDGTLKIHLIDEMETETLASYTGTWQVTELDAYSGLLLDMTCTQNNAPMELPDVIADEYVILRATDVDNLLLGIRDGQKSNLMVTEEDHYCSVWFGAVG